MATNISRDEKTESFGTALRADLLSGKYSPGEWLKQADLESSYGANRFEVRIALAELNAQGLLDHFPNRGYRVCQHSYAEREQLYEVRTLLEVAACRLVVQRATAEQIEEFERMVKKFDESIENERLGKLHELNYDLHGHLYEMTGNPILAAQIRNLRERGIPGRQGMWDVQKSIKESSADHFEMLDMLKRRDADGLAAAVYRHLNNWRRAPAGSAAATTAE
ncbi:GntR family transcriptional regulator [Massilia cavernae]|uniref:GntR family transcriptional regulator n=1 Tax=Massilia cavernae TaxID=2320864 RepID=A0A418XQZ6_9BURK|nr:GntR family transcriptional regulator [Massilia cavernae]RJG14867.1 GntR family transcriptional regulator [Massilia cavernae]